MGRPAPGFKRSGGVCHRGDGPPAAAGGLSAALCLRPGPRIRPHVLEVAGRKPLHVRKSRAQVVRQPLDHLCPPALLGLPRQNVAPDLPVQQDQFAVHRQRSSLLGAVDAGFQVLQPVGVAVWGRHYGRRDIRHDVAFIAKINPVRAHLAKAKVRPDPTSIDAIEA